MFGIHYLKAQPTQYVIHYQNGRLRHAGAGLAFFYYRPSASLAHVPLHSADAPFIFNETSADFQPLTVQGQLAYRIADPQGVAALLDFSIDGRTGAYRTEDPEKLPLRLVNLAQTLVRAETQTRSLQAAIHASEAIADQVLEKLCASPAVTALGVEVLALAIQAIRPSPEIARALEAEAREGLLRQADEAVYERRNRAVAGERRIKENELNTEIAVEQKKRQIREAKVEADLAVEAKEQQVRQSRLHGQIELEDHRRQLVAVMAENARAEADAQAYGVAAALRPLADLSPEVLMALTMQSAEPRRLIALALKDLAANAGKIGNLNIAPELLTSLMRE